MLEVELKGFERMAKGLQLVRRRAVPFAARDALNDAAFTARRMWGDQIRATFTTRNQYTAGKALQVKKAMGRDILDMESRVGSIEEYLARQEKGGTVSGPIPGPSAAGQPPGNERTRPVRRTSRIRRLNALKPGVGKNRKQRNAIAIAMAKRRGIKNVVLDREGGGQAVFRLMGGKRKVRTRLMWVVGKGPSKLDANPTLGPTIAKLTPLLPRMMRKAITRQFARHNLPLRFS